VASLQPETANQSQLFAKFWLFRLRIAIIAGFGCGSGGRGRLAYRGRKGIMGSCFRFLRYCVLFLAGVQGVALAADTSSSVGVGEMARIVAGMQPNPAGFEPAARDMFPAFARDVTAQWDSYRQHIGVPMANWACTEIDYTAGETIFYPFSGPDFSSVHQLYPQAGRYIMVAMQRAGLPPALDQQPPRELKRILSAYRDRWRFFARTGFYRTNDLEDFASRHEVTVSVTSQLMAFAARLGFDVESVEPVQISADGREIVVVTEDRSQASTWNSARLTLVKNGRRVIIDYLRMDLSDSIIAKNPANRAFIERAVANRTLVKAASHLLQKHYFSILRTAILKSAPSVVQDETGVEYALFADSFKSRLYGKFEKPHNLFQTNQQKSLAQGYLESKDIKPLSFRLGYDKTAGSAVVVATRGANPVVPARNCSGG
jgi:hypothetical protein